MNSSHLNAIEKQRLFHHLLAIIGTAFITVVALWLFDTGHMRLAFDTLILLLVIFWIGNLGFSAFFFVRISHHFNSEELVLPHMMWGQLGLLVLTWYAPSMHQITMMLSLTTFVFVSFGFSSLRLLLSVILVVLGHVWIALEQHAGHDLTDLALILVSYTMSAIFIALITSYFANLKVFMGNQNSLIQKRTHELEAAQRELTQAKERAEAAANSRTRFLAAASHDLRQPLYALELYIAALPDQDSEHVRQHIFTQMQRSAQELSALMNSLFDISRLDARMVPIQPKPVRLDEIVEGLEWEFRELSEALHRPLNVRTSAATVISDPILLRRVLRALVANALKHSKKGRVLVGFRTRGQRIRCEVWDSGQGIPASEQERIFEEFYQIGNSHRDRQHGLGLGLALVKRICAALNHELGMRSTVGRGSVFWFDMNKSTALAAPAPNRHENSSADPLFGCTVLCIDDEPYILEGTALLLQQWGGRAITASTPTEAIDKLEQEDVTPDLLLCDFRLANQVSGIVAMQQIIARLPHPIPGILITGDIDPTIAELSRDAGFRVLQKPISPAKLKLNIINTLKAGGR